ncbi:MAG: hypothetical protein HOO67_02055 [Candidatus Peribacteraceae bacterium]|nr:hypothetical protein [Candidatus Peribacteraceae bacterium]
METPETPQAQIQPPPAAPAPVSEKDDIEQNKDIAAFSYLWIMSVVVYFLKRKSPFVRFHAKQAMVLFLLSVIFLFIPIVSKILELGVLALMVLGFINAAQGHKKDIPIIGPLSRGEISLREAWKQIVDYVARLMKNFHSEKASSPAQPTPPPAENPADQPSSSSSSPS